MLTLDTDQKLKCPYCREEQEYGVLDYVTPIMNLNLLGIEPEYEHSERREQCEHCDEYFHLRLSTDNQRVYVANMPQNLAWD